MNAEATVSPTEADLLSRDERWSLGLRLVLAALATGLLLMSLGIRWLWDGQSVLAELVACAAALIAAGPVFVRGWWAIWRPSLPGITDQLVSIAVLAALADGAFELAALVPLALSIGAVLEERSLLGSRETIAAMARLTQGHARRLDGADVVHEVVIEELVAEDRIEVLPGGRIPADGRIESGRSHVDSAPITGESVPAWMESGGSVFAGAIALDGRLVVRVERVGADTALGKVVRLLSEAERAKPPITRLLERHAGRYLLVVAVLAVGSFFLTGEMGVLMAVLVASCPVALAVAAPATSVAALAVAGRHGILVKGTAFLEELATVDEIVLDKTGTVTVGALRLAGVDALDGADEDAAIRLAAGIAAGSLHPISKALAATVPSEERPSIGDIREDGGRGVVASHDGVALRLGRSALHSDAGVRVPTPPRHDGPIVGLSRGDRFLAWFRLADTPRAEAKLALAELRALGLSRQILLTGDKRSVAERIADELGIDEVDADVLPEQKLARVRSELDAGRRPMVIGDGVNDALALRAGAVGVAMGAGGSDVALASSDLVLMSDDLRRLGAVVRLSRRARRTLTINVAIALLWTVAMLIAATVGTLGPVVAMLLHNVGTVVVLMNAGRLLRFEERSLSA